MLLNVDRGRSATSLCLWSATVIKSKTYKSVHTSTPTHPTRDLRLCSRLHTSTVGYYARWEVGVGRRQKYEPGFSPLALALSLALIGA